MASKAAESKPSPRPTIGEETFLPPPPPDRNCRGQSERPFDEKCSGAKGPASQDEKFISPSTRSAVRSSQDFTTGGSKDMKDSLNQKSSTVLPPPALTSTSPTEEQIQSEEKMKQKNVTEKDNRQDSQQQQPENQESSNGAEATSTPEDGGNAGDTMNSKGTGLPKELTSKFGPLKCDLCNVSVNSTVQARMHYTGKQHDKKVNQFLANWSQETGQPIPKRARETSAAKKAALEPKDMYCNVCDLALTSSQHAQQHYMGKNHQRALQGRSSKTAAKWQRTPQGDAAAKGVDPFSSDPLGLKDLPDGPPSKKGRFYCELCQVMATSQDQLDMHLRGAKHRKAEKASGVGTKLSSWTGSNVIAGPTIPPPAASDSILASVIKTDDAMSRKPGIKDYSIYRTPSGDYYCGMCTVICNREDVFHTHMISKKHAKREKIMKEKAALQGDDNAEAFLSNLKKTITGNVEKVSSNLFFCKLCDLSVSSKEELERHIATEEHMDKVGKSDLFMCHVCNLSLESEEHIALHCTQEEHKRKLQQDT